MLLGLAYDAATAEIEAERLAARSPGKDVLTLLSALVARRIAPAGRREQRPWIVSTRVDSRQSNRGHGGAAITTDLSSGPNVLQLTTIRLSLLAMRSCA